MTLKTWPSICSHASLQEEGLYCFPSARLKVTLTNRELKWWCVMGEIWTQKELYLSFVLVLGLGLHTLEEVGCCHGRMLMLVAIYVPQH